MKKLYSLLVLTFVFIAAVSADEYVVSSWEKSKLSGETAVSADKLLIGDKPIDVMQPLRLNPYDSLVVINTTTNRASIYVNCSDKVKILKVNDIVKRRSLNVFITMLSETFAPRKEEPQPLLSDPALRPAGPYLQRLHWRPAHPPLHPPLSQGRGRPADFHRPAAGFRKRFP